MTTLVQLEARVAALENKAKVERLVKQVVFDREGAEVKVRAKVLLKTATGTEEKWEEVTEKFPNAQEVLNGA